MGSGSGGSGKDNNNDGGLGRGGGGGEEESVQTHVPESVHREEEADGKQEHEELPGADVDTTGEGVNGTCEPQEPPAGPEAGTEDEPSAPARQDAGGSAEGASTAGSPSSPKDEGHTSSDKSSSAVGSSKSPTENEQETLGEDSGSGTPPTVPRALLAKRVSAADPDPTWALHLLKKLEKQFMSHYMAAMVEFKVRWELEDNVLLDTMISELRDEVGRRIQSSVGRELKKIQGRAGKGGRTPRPPLGNLSRESTMTERRRQMLKV